MISKIIEAMIKYYKGDMHDINHFLKVYAFAKTIGELEGLNAEEQFTLEVAAAVHDIACPLCRSKYGNTMGKHQEEESEDLLREFLPTFNLDADILERVIYLVCHHHTYQGADGKDYQILLEADYLVNADESNYSKANIESAYANIFKTASGKALLETIHNI